MAIRIARTSARQIRTTDIRTTDIRRDAEPRWVEIAPMTMARLCPMRRRSRRRMDQPPAWRRRVSAASMAETVRCDASNQKIIRDAIARPNRTFVGVNDALVPVAPVSVARGGRALVLPPTPVAMRGHIVWEFVHAGKPGQSLLDIVTVADADVLPNAEMRARCDEHRDPRTQEPFEEACRRNRQPYLTSTMAPARGRMKLKMSSWVWSPALKLREIRMEGSIGCAREYPRVVRARWRYAQGGPTEPRA